MNKNWAICIGINDYHRLQPLKYAVQDASSVRDFFLNEVNFEKVYYFSDDSPSIESPRGDMRSLPTYANLKYFFREWFQSKLLNVGDNFWFFFAGHGEIHEDHDYLLPIDVDPGDIEGTALRMSDIADSLRNCGADNTVLLVDACRDRGKRKGQGFGVEAQQGLITIYSCSPNKSSYEIEALQHGSFTYALLEGLRLQGANNCATVERLNQYLCAEVPAINESHGKPFQLPRTSVEPISKNHLILIPQLATRLQDVLVLKHDAQRAELEEDLELAQQLWVRVLAASAADGDAITAIQRIALKRSQYSPRSTSSFNTVGSRRVRTRATTNKPKSSLPSRNTSNTSRRAELIEEPKLLPNKPLLLEFEVFTISRVEKRGWLGLGTPQVMTRIQKARAGYRQENIGESSVALTLIVIPGGNFLMGSPDGSDRHERPQHRVTVRPFLMGKYPVTQTQWRAVAAFPKVERDLKPEPLFFEGINRPVRGVSWDDAVEFCSRLSQQTGREYRLPSEAEWEYACRASTTSPFHFGETLTSDLANYNATCIL